MWMSTHMDVRMLIYVFTQCSLFVSANYIWMNLEEVISASKLCCTLSNVWPQFCSVWYVCCRFVPSSPQRFQRIILMSVLLNYAGPDGMEFCHLSEFWSLIFACRFLFALSLWPGSATLQHIALTSWAPNFSWALLQTWCSRYSMVLGIVGFQCHCSLINVLFWCLPCPQIDLDVAETTAHDVKHRSVSVVHRGHCGESRRCPSLTSVGIHTSWCMQFCNFLCWCGMVQMPVDVRCYVHSQTCRGTPATSASNLSCAVL